jgi:hypothetical protein
LCIRRRGVDRRDFMRVMRGSVRGIRLAVMADPTEAASLIHGVRADDEHWTDVWNFSLEGTRGSLGLINLSEQHTTPYDVDLTVLAGPPQHWPPMFLSGFMITMRLGAIVRSSGQIGWGVPPYPTRWAPQDVAQRILRNADRELALEAGRRVHAPSAPSRLCCLWLAEDGPGTRTWLTRMLGVRSFVMRVRLTIELRTHRCDARWLDDVHRDPCDARSVAGYWSGLPRDDDVDALWEVLLEGQIATADSEELARLREFIQINGPPADLLGPPPAELAEEARTEPSPSRRPDGARRFVQSDRPAGLERGAVWQREH